MNYFILRQILAIIYLILNVFILFLIKMKLSKIKFIISLIISVICFGVFSIYMGTPIEQRWVKFDTIEQAFKYSYPEDEIVKIIEKDNYAIVIYDFDNRGRTVTFFKKVDNKWLVTNGSNSKQKLYYTQQYGIITDRSTDGKTKFIAISFSNITGANKEISISDNYNTKFIYVETMEKSGDMMYEYYGIIENIKDDYYLTINGNTVSLNETSDSSIIFAITIMSCGIVWIIAYIIFDYLKKKHNE